MNIWKPDPVTRLYKNGITFRSEDRMILLVDDQPENIDILIAIIGDEHEISVALDGEDALEIINEEKPSLIFLDVIMPGIDGYEICRRIKEDPETEGINVVFLSGNFCDEDRKKGKDLGALNYLKKPINPAEILDIVKNYS